MCMRESIDLKLSINFLIATHIIIEIATQTTTRNWANENIESTQKH